MTMKLYCVRHGKYLRKNSNDDWDCPDPYCTTIEVKSH